VFIHGASLPNFNIGRDIPSAVVASSWWSAIRRLLEVRAPEVPHRLPRIVPSWLEPLPSAREKVEAEGSMPFRM